MARIPPSATPAIVGERPVVGHGGDRHVLTNAHELGVGTEPLVHAEHPVADVEAGHARLPCSTTTPANSVPSVRYFGRRSPLKKRTKNGRGSRNPQSVRFTVAVWTSTSTSSAAGTGRRDLLDPQHVGTRRTGRGRRPASSVAVFWSS